MTTSVKRAAAAAVLAVLALIATASVALGQASQEVTISDSLEPARLEIATGTAVTWVNTDGERHRMRSREGPVEFDSGNLETGDSFTFTFTVEGTYPYLDQRAEGDPAYHGTIVVGPAPGTGEESPTSAVVTIVDEAFHPPLIEVATGATVEWRHIDGDEEHTVTSTHGAFDSGVMAGGETFTQTFLSPGSFAYVCGIHPEMQGTVTVVGPPLEPAPEPTPAGTGGEAGLSPTPEASGLPTGSAVSIIDFAFEPPAIEVSAGSTVSWRNEDGVGHTVTADDGAFDSGALSSGAEYSRTFEEPGTYAYFCAFHPSMTGTVTVTGPGSG